MKKLDKMICGADGKNLLLSYTVLDGIYNNGLLMYVRGKNGGTTGRLNSIKKPEESGVTLAPTDGDPVVHSLVYGNDIRILLGKIVTPGTTSTCKYSLISTPNTLLAQDVELQYPSGTAVAGNPRGVAQIGNMLYIVEFDTPNVWRLNADELNGVTATAYTLPLAPFDLTDILGDVAATAHGQAIIALKNGSVNYLYVLYTVSPSPNTVQLPGRLVRITLDANGGAASLDIVEVGINPQSIIPVTDGKGVVQLLIPAIGGIQGAGTTNETDSNISVIEAFGSWPAPDPDPVPIPVLLTGDAVASPLTAYDLRAVAASMERGGSGIVYILTAIYNASYSGTDWRLYRTTVDDLLGLTNSTIANAISKGVLEVVEDGQATSPDFAGVYYWDILYETGDTVDGDRLWFLRGSPIHITRIAEYSTASAIPDDAATYRYFDIASNHGPLGSDNVNSVDLLPEAFRQARKGVSLKRSLGPKGVRARAIAKPEEEEEKGKK